MLKVKSVEKNSIASELGIKIGDLIVKINGVLADDQLDLIYADALDFFALEILNEKGETSVFEIEKLEEETLGITAEEKPVKLCHNNCIFCFVSQMPKGLRESLYVKDDDVNMSFKCGNFVTLTNLSDEELERIRLLKLSPLYVSVHAMNGKLRAEMLRNKNADKIRSQLKKLVEAGVKIRTQIVLVKGVNDGAELDYTLNELYKLKKGVTSVAVVPCGVTKFRDNLYKIEEMDANYCKEVILQIDAFNKKAGKIFAYASDDFFVKADMPLLNHKAYKEYEQIENGVGMLTLFEKEVNEAIKKIKIKKIEKKVLILTGVASLKFIKAQVEKAIKKVDGLSVKVVGVQNEFFGNSVTCSGLLVGQDIINAIKKEEEYDEIMLPANTLKSGEEVFLDGVTLSEVQSETSAKIKINDGGIEFINNLVEYE